MTTLERCFVEHAAYLWFRPVTLVDTMRQECNIALAVALAAVVARLLDTLWVAWGTQRVARPARAASCARRTD